MIKRIITNVALALACFVAGVADSSAVSVSSGVTPTRVTRIKVVQHAQIPSKKPVVPKVTSRKIGSVKHNCASCLRKGSTVVHVSMNPKKTAYKKVVRKPATLSTAQRNAVRRAFAEGKAGGLSSSKLLSAQVFTREALKGGIFRRPGAVKFIILHSTETAREADAKRVIRSWNNSGVNHSGTQYVVDRDGVIYETVDPAWGTYHVDTSKTRFGVKNGNSVGIEIVRSGQQRYTVVQLKSLSRLVAYLQSRFQIAEDGIVSHGYVQPADRTDPVAFDWVGFSRLMKQTNPKPVLVNILRQSGKA